VHTEEGTPLLASSRKRRSGAPARSNHASHRQAQQAQAQLAAGGLSHAEQRRLHAVLQAREESSRRRRRHQKRLVIVLTGAIAAMAIGAVAFGLIPAIDAALGGGVTGKFTVQNQVCVRRAGCQWVGTFQPRKGSAIAGLAYGGTMPDSDGPGSVIPARHPAGKYVYALHGTHTWVQDLLITLVIGTAVGFLIWVSPLGAGDRNPEGARTSA
jgi:hypothetical protein